MTIMSCVKSLEGHGVDGAYQVEEQPGCFIISRQALLRAHVH